MVRVDASTSMAMAPTGNGDATADPAKIHADSGPGCHGDMSPMGFDVADDEKTRWAIDVMTAWALDDHHDRFVHDRIDAYADEPQGSAGLITGLVNLSGLLLSGLEVAMGKEAKDILQAIGSTIARNEASHG